MPPQASTLLCVDVSYVLFYRYNALRRWYRHRHQEDIPEAYVRSDEFTTLFHKRLQGTQSPAPDLKQVPKWRLRVPKWTP